ncbi:hypothetical protein BpHYR1_028546 [Brachionus plicatilis]|uniref:Uncharacterized protein n=1 Tax=Brachionus plicatilis TaxID=10195 RepID=A0A3M7R4N1_BRAPC|nr:hypothetical protein BpHYR1_028546 [Brachionus plicatilis]
MKISVEKSCSVVFTWYKKESDNLNLKIYGNRIVSQFKKYKKNILYGSPLQPPQPPPPQPSLQPSPPPQAPRLVF